MQNVKTEVMLVITATNHRISQTIPEQQSGEEGTTDNNNIRHCTHTSESNNVRVQNVCRGEYNYIYYIL